MIFEQNKSIENLGEKIGFIFGYFLFTTVLFSILTLLNRIPVSWSYFHIMAVTSLIASVGAIIKRVLK